MKKIFKIKGMHCDSCVKLIQSELQDRVNKVEIDISKGIAKIDFNENKITDKEIKNIIVNLGYSCE